MSPNRLSHPSRRPAAAATLASLLAGLLALGACGQRSEPPTVGQQVDAGIAKVERGAERAKAEIQQGTAEVKREVQQAASEVRSAAGDAAITSAVNAQLARDNELSALKIDVDTSDGRVALKGSAPNREALERASRLAAGVDGVKSVDNRLDVKG